MSVGCQPDLGGGLVLMDASSSCDSGANCGGQGRTDYPGVLLPWGSAPSAFAAVDGCGQPPGGQGCRCNGSGGGGDWGCGSRGGGGGAGGGGGDLCLGDCQFFWTSPMGGPSGWSSCPGGHEGGSGGLDFFTWLSAAQCPPPSGPRCVHPDTWVSLYPTGRKRAGEVRVGDLLLSCGPQGELVGEEVTEVGASEQPCLRIELENGSRLRCSFSHTLIVHDLQDAQGRVLRAERLGLGERLLLADNVPVGVRAIVCEEVGPVVQIQLAGPNHCFLSEGVWSHNKAQGQNP